MSQGAAGWRRKIRHALSVRDGGMVCVVCRRYGGGNSNVSIHHITPKSKGGSGDLDNLVLLCVRCHRKEHEDADASGRQGSPSRS